MFAGSLAPPVATDQARGEADRRACALGAARARRPCRMRRGRAHLLRSGARAPLACGRVETVRLFDPSPARARDVTRLLPATVAPSWEAVLDGPDELAIVASPPVAHGQQVQALLEHGKHVLCEKPFILDRAEGESLADLARERGLACAVGMVRRFSRSACLLRRLLSEERPTRLVWHEGGPFRWPVASPAYFAPEAGNSLLWDIGSHVVDLLIWWLGAPDEVTCRDDAMGGTATNCLLELAWPDGCSARCG